MSGTLHLHRHTGFRRLGFGHDLQQLHYRTLVGKPARCATRCTLTSPRPVVQQQEQMEEPQLVLPPNTSRKWRPLSNSARTTLALHSQDHLSGTAESAVAETLDIPCVTISFESSRRRMDR